MGEVYQATDTNLKREVALKVLPASVAADAVRLARFQREAEVLAALNHPNIAAIYGLEKSNGIIALVMELVEGDDLSQRIAKGAIPFDEALPIAKQIADALEAAHEQGIIHRDLKPANIKVRSDGTVKVLDFGLAKALAPAGSKDPAYEHLTQSPTLTTPAMTQAGMILGTAAYMAPEQARGKTVDKRADIWAFGAVLYEMLTGQRAFPGEDLTDTLAAVVRAEPNWTLLPSGLSSSLVTYIKRCLHKDLKQRIPDIAAMRLALEGAFETAASPAMGAGTISASHRRRPLLAVLGGAAAVAALVGIVIGVGISRWTTPRAPSPLVTRTDVALPPGVTEIGPSINNVDVSISADGRRIAYLAAKNGVEQLYVRSLDQLETRLILSGTTGQIRGPALSPDGNWIAFLDENANRLKKIAVSGGPQTVVGPALGATRGIVWDGNDTIVLATSDISTGILRVPAAGGTPEVLTTPKAGEDHDYPFALPGRNAILFTLVSQGAPNQIVLLNLATKQESRLIQNGSNARYSPSGHLLYVADGSLRAVAFDLSHLEVRGEAVPVVNDVATKGVGAGQFALSSTGTLFYLHGKLGTSARTLVWVDRHGREEPTGIPPNFYSIVRLSPDGTRVAVDTRDLRSAISTWDLSRRILTTVVIGPGVNRAPLWSPDGRRIAFSAERDGTQNIYWQNADGTGLPQRLTQGRRLQLPNAFTPDGKGLLFGEPGASPYDLGFADLATGRSDLILHAPYNESEAALSPDGRWLAYQSNESGQEEIYVRPFPNIETGRWKLSTGGGTRPAWARNGRELFYYLPPGKVFAVPVREGGTFSFDSPQVIIDGTYPAPNWTRQYDVSADGTRFLMLKNVADSQATPSQLVLVQNWFEELNRLVPTN